MIDKKNMQILFDNHKYFYEVPTTKNAKYMIGLSVKDGLYYLNIREFYRKAGAEDEGWKPSTRGMLIPYNKRIRDEDGEFFTSNIAGDIIASALMIEEHIKSFPIYNENNMVTIPKRISKKAKAEVVDETEN